MRRHLAVLGVLAALLVLTLPAPATAAGVPGLDLPGVGDCKEAPTPEMPGDGIAGFFAGTPDELPKPGDPFVKGSQTTIYEQYGFAGLRWETYDLGCGPDAMRNPDAIIGTAMANWFMQVPLALTALTGSLTQVAFEPTFLDGFDPIISKVSGTLHTNLFEAWVPVVLALTGAGIILLSRRAAMASTAAAVGWAILVVLLATAIFRWPTEAGHVADEAVAGTLGAVVNKLDSTGGEVDSGTAVASSVESSILYRGWVAGTLGNADSATAQKYGPELFKAHAVSWAEAAYMQKNPSKAKDLIEAKKDQWMEVASQVENEDPAAYEHLTGKRSESRVGYAIVSAVGTLLALPFLLVSALLMLGCFLIVRLAVMMFPAFAVLGIFPASRGLVIGLGRTVGAAVVNAIVFGVGAGVTVVVLGLLLDPGGGAPAWLGLVLMPLFSFIMWVALKPFRRLTHMVTGRDHFSNMAGAGGDVSRSTKKWAKRSTAAAVGAYTGGAAAGATMAALEDDAPQRAEAQPATVSSAPPPAGASPHVPQQRPPLPLETASAADGPTTAGVRPDRPTPSLPASSGTGGATSAAASGAWSAGSQSEAAAAPHAVEGFSPHAAEPGVPTVVEPEWEDGEEIYPIYRGTPEMDQDGAVVDR